MQIKVDPYTTVNLNGFDESIRFEQRHEDGDRYFSIVIKSISKNLKFDGACILQEQCIFTYSDGDIQYQQPNTMHITTFTGNLLNDNPILDGKLLGYRSDSGDGHYTICNYIYDVTISTCEEIKIEELDEIAEQYFVVRNTWDFSYNKPQEKIVKKDKNGNIIDQYYVDMLYIKYKSFVGNLDKKYFLIMDYNENHHEILQFGFDEESGNVFKCFDIYTDDHDINIRKLVNACNEVATQFYFDTRTHYKIDDVTHEIEYDSNGITISNSKFKNMPSSLSSQHEYLEYSTPSYSVPNVGCDMFLCYSNYYKSMYIGENGWTGFDFAGDWNNILSMQDHCFTVYSSISDTYRSVYEKIKDIYLDIDLSHAQSNDHVIKFYGFIGLIRVPFDNFSNYYDSSINILFSHNDISPLNKLDNNDEFLFELQEHKLVFMPFGKAREWFDLSCCNLDQKIEIYTKFYPVICERYRQVKLLNVGKSSDFSVIENVTLSQINDTNSQNNKAIEYSSSNISNHNDFENEIMKSSSECELLVMNMMTNYYRYENGLQYCAFKESYGYDLINPSIINACIYDTKTRVFDIVYIVHCPYGGGTLDSGANLYKDIELMKYGPKSKQNIIGIAQYGSSSGGHYIDKNQTNTLLMQSLIRHFHEHNTCGTYSQFINDFNARSKTIRNAVVNEIKAFAASFQQIITNPDNMTFSFNANKQTNKTFLLKINDKRTLTDEIRKNNDFISDPNKYLLNEDENPCMFQTYFACLAQSTFIKNIYLNHLYEQNIYLQLYRSDKQTRITKIDNDLGIEVYEDIMVPGGYILSQILAIFSKQFDRAFGNKSVTDSNLRSILESEILFYNNNTAISSPNDYDDPEDLSHIPYDTKIYDLWKIFHRAIVPLFFSYTLAKINVMKDEIDWNNGNIDENQLINGELNRYIGVLNEIFIQTVIHIYHIWKMRSSISEQIGIKENEQSRMWDLLFSIIPTSWPHAKVLSKGNDNDNFMNRVFLT